MCTRLLVRLAKSPSFYLNRFLNRTIGTVPETRKFPPAPSMYIHQIYTVPMKWQGWCMQWDLWKSNFFPTRSFSIPRKNLLKNYFCFFFLDDILQYSENNWFKVPFLHPTVRAVGNCTGYCFVIILQRNEFDLDTNDRTSRNFFSSPSITSHNRNKKLN